MFRGVLGSAVIAVAVMFSATSAQALTLAEGLTPAEFPPPDYKADTFVDSRGCVYIRAGVGDAARWVPRVSRARKVVCGAKPTFAPESPVVTQQAAPAPKPAPSPAPAPKPAAAPAPKMAAAPPAPAPAKPAPLKVSETLELVCPPDGAQKTVRTASGRAVPLRCEASQTGRKSYLVRFPDALVRVVVTPAPAARAPVKAVAASPVLAKRAPAKPAPAPVKPAATLAPAKPEPMRTVHVTCPDRTGVSRAYTNDGRVIPVRCGPQQVPPVTYLVRYGDGTVLRVVAAPAGGAGQAIAKPGIRPTAATTVSPPPGYKPAWTDGRLNPARGPRTAEGDASMHLMWTDTVPRRLVDADTGQDFTASFRNLVYPALPSAREAALARQGKVVVYGTKAPGAAAAVSARPAASAGEVRWVQAASFGVPQNARKTAARLRALGLPVEIRPTRYKGKALELVLVGPLDDPGALQAALAKVRSAGFADAFLRR